MRIAPTSLTRRKSIRAAKAPTMTTLTQVGRKLQKEANVYARAIYNTFQSFKITRIKERKKERETKAING